VPRNPYDVGRLTWINRQSIALAKDLTQLKSMGWEIDAVPTPASWEFWVGDGVTIFSPQATDMRSRSLLWFNHPNPYTTVAHSAEDSEYLAAEALAMYLKNVCDVESPH
jgi:hypothetical protein